jgi:hypothetical protein
MSTLVVPQKPVEEIARDAPPEITLIQEERDRVAHLATELARAENARAGALDPSFIPYPERSDLQKAAARLGVVRVIQALTMLGYLEP